MLLCNVSVTWPTASQVTTGQKERIASRWSLLKLLRIRLRRNPATHHQAGHIHPGTTMITEAMAETKANTGSTNFDRPPRQSSRAAVTTFVRPADPDDRRLGGSNDSPTTFQNSNQQTTNSQQPQSSNTFDTSSSEVKHFSAQNNATPHQSPLTSNRNSFAGTLQTRFEQLRNCILTRKNSEPNYFQLFDICVSQRKMNLKYDIRETSPSPKVPLFECTLRIDGVLISKGNGKSKKDSRISAYEEAFQKLTSPGMRINRNFQTKDFELEAFAMPVCARGSGPQGLQRDISGKRGDLVLIDYSDISHGINSVAVLHDSAQSAGLVVEYSFLPSAEGNKCKVAMGGVDVGEGSGASKPEAKLSAASDALAYLKTQVYTIKIKKVASGDKICREEIMSSHTPEKELGDDNRGKKLLQMMGWTGGGLGKAGNEGITEPVKVKDVYGREGLGSAGNRTMNLAQFRTKMQQIVQSYANSDNQQDLVFSPEFSIEERKEIHLIAKRYHLKDASHGKGDQRYLVLSRKRRPKQLLEFLLEMGGSTDKYDLIPPTSG